MPYLSTSELANMRADAELTLPDSCTIAYLTPVIDSVGAVTDSWTNRGTAIACRLNEPAANAAIEAGQVSERQRPILSTAHAQTVTVSDKVTIGGRVFFVSSVNASESERLLTRAELEETL
jgi:hypothetical protein